MSKTQTQTRTLKALSVVCLHTTLPLVEKQAQEIEDLKRQLEKTKKMMKFYRKLSDTYDVEVREWLEGFNYDEDYDKDKIRDGEEPFFNNREYYADDEIW